MNAVNIIGMLRENIDDYYRYFEYERPYDEKSTVEIAKIVVKHWSNQPKSRLITMPINARVAITGHLDANEKFGTILVVEQIQSVK